MKVKFVVDQGKYRANRIYELPDKDAVRFLRQGKAKAYVSPPEKAVIK